jgi:regulator of ribonuclease activity A
MPSTPDLSDGAPEARALELQWRDYGARAAFCGQAVTIKCFEDNSLVKACVAEPGAGRVIVVDGGGSLRRALLGDQLAMQAADNGWAGLLIWGAVRDVEILAGLPLGIKALGQCPRKTEKRGEGQRELRLCFGGTTIDPGEWVYADRNGVLVSAVDLLA